MTFFTKEILEWEIDKPYPDYAFLCFGANDLGCWLYDAEKEETAELLKEREQRDEKFFIGYDSIINKLIKKGIKPIILSPFAMNERLIEKENIETITDNQEKQECISSSFYKSKAFKKMNDHLAFYAKKLKETAKERNLLFLDIFTQTRELMQSRDGLFIDDGIHYTPKGHAEIAKILLKYMGCTDIPESFEKTERNDAIFAIEQEERSIMFLPANIFNPSLGKFTLWQITERAQALLADEKTPDWLRVSSRNFLTKREDVPKMRRKIEELTYEI